MAPKDDDGRERKKEYGPTLVTSIADAYKGPMVKVNDAIIYMTPKKSYSRPCGKEADPHLPRWPGSPPGPLHAQQKTRPGIPLNNSILHIDNAVSHTAEMTRYEIVGPRLRDNFPTTSISAYPAMRSHTYCGRENQHMQGREDQHMQGREELHMQGQEDLHMQGREDQHMQGREDLHMQRWEDLHMQGGKDLHMLGR
ncbi:hypothetical protein MAR_006563 [Mya arenaria]|uniref:Uncharacterized protein n=1 Tax=Mya arenaria TaxID=6604 RepID=A0ABY7D8W9_MYAAR|nr:hypothetical protein MAR_006563 [Mya arenaria]